MESIYIYTELETVEGELYVRLRGRENDMNVERSGWGHGQALFREMNG